MIDANTSEFTFDQKYRPHRVADIILPVELKKTFQKYVDGRNIPNLLLVGTSGVGKTTVAKAMLEEIGADVLFINGSLERGIDVIRDRIAQFVSTVSFQGTRKFVLIDEADGLTPDGQKAMRAFIEEFSHNAGFILTANAITKIIPALQSRCSIVEFRIGKDEVSTLAAAFMGRAEKILKLEDIKYERKALAALIERFYPDWRHILVEMQRYSASGKIDAGILAHQETNISELIDFMRKRDYTNVRKWVGENSDLAQPAFYRKFYDTVTDLFPPQIIPQVVLTLSKYSFQSAFAVDAEINMSACLAEIMVDADGLWKN